MVNNFFVLLLFFLSPDISLSFSILLSVPYLNKSKLEKVKLSKSKEPNSNKKICFAKTLNLLLTTYDYVGSSLYHSGDLDPFFMAPGRYVTQLTFRSARSSYFSQLLRSVAIATLLHIAAAKGFFDELIDG